MKDILKNKWFWIAIGVIFLILLYRWWKCKQSGCPSCTSSNPPCTLPCRSVSCSFWTGKEKGQGMSGLSAEQKKQIACAEKTGFNILDLTPGATTTTMGMNKDKYEACINA